MILRYLPTAVLPLNDLARTYQAHYQIVLRLSLPALGEYRIVVLNSQIFHQLLSLGIQILRIRCIAWGNWLVRLKTELANKNLS